MRAARFYGAGDVRIDEIDPPTRPGPGQVLLRIATAGICGSDGLEYSRGPVLVHPPAKPHPVTGHTGPLTLGHEFAGYVAAVGPGVEELREGMLVASGAGVSCGNCSHCRAGRTNLCESYATIGFHWDGALAEYCLAPAGICIDAGAYGLGPDTAAMAQPMAIAVHAARRGRIAEGDAALVIGAGGIGSFLTFAAAGWGARVIVSDLDEQRLAIASALGAERTIAVSATMKLEAELERAGVRPDVVFEISGSAAGLEQAVAIAPRGGRVVAVGVQKAAPPVDMRRVTLDELELIGTVAHVCRDDLPEALRLLALRREGWADVAPDVLSLDRLVADGIRPLAEGTSTRVKTLIDPAAGASRRSFTAPS